ncbi:putative dehydrogenase [Deinococcus peraridilitoris DSM 19664]|uniref:Putative dehydrogenase n=2 Tax=Deinococcus TaxID=1298 RepID=L0A838_DEIPD|nr:putative dehydrogenase [Deinococcus peraridilitoris DSM 19664]
MRLGDPYMDLIDTEGLGMRAGIIGCGNISGIYLKNLPKFGVPVVAVADLNLDLARARAEEYGVARACRVEELLADSEVDVVVNLTVPAAHAEVAMAALRAGKHVYNEKPLATSLDDARALLAEAASRGLLVGCAPDTVLGAGLQTCRALLDEGQIGAPVAGTAFMLSGGPESWHPNPAFFYAPGGGPLFDMGPYYLSALITMLGPVSRVTGFARAHTAEREVGSGALKGERFPVLTPSHVAGVLEFASGPVVTLVTSFDVLAHETPRLELYGTEGALSLPDPNTFGGPVKLAGREREWRTVELTHPFDQNSRGLGVADLVQAAAQGRTPRASGQLALHVLEVMHALLQAAEQGRATTITSMVERPDAMPSHTTSGGVL